MSEHNTKFNAITLFVAPVIFAMLSIANTASGTVTDIALYELEGVVGAVVPPPVDSSGNANHYQNTNGTAATYSADASPAAGSTTSAAFGSAGDGSGGYFFTAAAIPEDNFGFEVWAKTTQADASGSARHLLGNSSNASGIEVGVEEGEYYAAISSVAFVSKVPIVDNTWTNLALVRDSGTTSFYVNGAFVASSASAPIAVPGANSHFGVNAGGMKGYVGLADNARFFSFAPGEFSPSDLSINATVTPEPSAFALCALGLIGLAGYRRRHGRVVSRS